MTTKNCVKCNVEFTYEHKNPQYPDNRKYCDSCKKINDAAYAASLKPSNPIPAQPVPVNAPVEKVPATVNEVVPERGNFQSTVWNHSVAANSSELGKIGDRHKIYWETVEELNKKKADLQASGFLQEEFKPEHE